jgi:cell fate regulator YaaT (PSP1 superfamily)
MSGSTLLQLVTVRTPERGVYTVRSSLAGVRRGQTVVLVLGGSEDVGEVVDVQTYDPARHGPDLPGYFLARVVTADDEAKMAANAQTAAVLKDRFLARVRETFPDVRMPHARLALGGGRLFVWYVYEKGRLDLNVLRKAFAREAGIQLNAWQVGPRDEVALLGAIGPCGRPCCCATWQTQYPAADRLARSRAGGLSGSYGMCNRPKCCLAFEEKDVAENGESS